MMVRTYYYSSVEEVGPVADSAVYALAKAIGVSVNKGKDGWHYFRRFWRPLGETNAAALVSLLMLHKRSGKKSSRCLFHLRNGTLCTLKEGHGGRHVASAAARRFPRPLAAALFEK